MSAADDLTELVERAAAAERAALAAKWKPRADVDAVRRRVRLAVDEQRDVEWRSTMAAWLSARRSASRQALLLGDTDAAGTATAGAASVPEVDSPRRSSDAAIDDGSSQVGFAEAARIEAEAVVAVTVARLALDAPRALMREISDRTSNAEARGFAEQATRSGATAPDPVGASVREPKQ